MFCCRKRERSPEAIYRILGQISKADDLSEFFVLAIKQRNSQKD